ncbi:hypothetical protein [Streptomyces sp. MJM8645]|uniref:hypothetical protein n=1 Tax=Streptomycetaceae TaxID=2062 RepID=UPI0007AF4C89|nr:hypothetical protein [Streptomyces sp. MJM8645]
MSIHPVDFHQVIVTKTTEYTLARPALTCELLRVVRADQVKTGDLIVSAFQPAGGRRMPIADYFHGGAYVALPAPYDPNCGCGVCGLDEVQGPEGTVVLTSADPWHSCGPWPADEPVLILPYPGQALTVANLERLVCGLPLNPIDFRSPASQRHYMNNGWYLTEEETAAL